MKKLKITFLARLSSKEEEAGPESSTPFTASHTQGLASSLKTTDIFLYTCVLSQTQDCTINIIYMFYMQCIIVIIFEKGHGVAK
jgi:hypothetical protein